MRESERKKTKKKKRERERERERARKGNIERKDEKINEKKTLQHPSVTAKQDAKKSKALIGHTMLSNTHTSIPLLC